MRDKLCFIRFPALLLIIYFVGKLTVGALGGSYELGLQIFAMVPLTIHLCLAWGAVSRALRGDGLKDALLTGLLIAVVAQLLIFVGTVGSYLIGVETAFNNSMAIVREVRAVSFGEAVGVRAFGIFANGILGAIAALIGWALGGLVPGPRKETAESPSSVTS